MGSSKRILGVVCAVALGARLLDATAGPWDLDTTYGDGGIASYDPDKGVHPMVVNNDPYRRVDVRPLSDGTLLEFSEAPAGVTLRLRDVNGRPDLAFGVAGTMLINFPAGFSPNRKYPTQDSHGRFHWCGSIDPNGDGVRDMAILRYTAAGVLDPAFGEGGVAARSAEPFLVPNAYGETCELLAFQSDGRIVAAVGRRLSANGTATGKLRRFNADGSSDPVFGAGTGAVDVGEIQYGYDSLQVLPNGWIMVAGPYPEVTLDSAGIPIVGPTIHPNLPRPTYPYAEPYSWQVFGLPGSGDMLLVTPDETGNVLVAREFRDGTLDRSFGGSGTGIVKVQPFAHRELSGYAGVTFLIASLSQEGQYLYIQAERPEGSSGRRAGELIRVFSSGVLAGQLDTSFGVGGRIDWPLWGYSLKEQSANAVLLVGQGAAIRLSANSGPSPGILGFSSDFVSGDDSSSIAVRVLRVAGDDGAASVRYRTRDRSGIAGVNYESNSGQLRWEHGDSQDKLITLNLRKGTASPMPGFDLVLEEVRGAILPGIETHIHVGVSGTAPSVPAGAVWAPVAVEPESSGGGAADPLSLLMLLLGGGAALRARARKPMN